MGFRSLIPSNNGGISATLVVRITSKPQAACAEPSSTQPSRALTRGDELELIGRLSHPINAMLDGIHAGQVAAPVRRDRGLHPLRLVPLPNRLPIRSGLSTSRRDVDSGRGTPTRVRGPTCENDPVTSDAPAPRIAEDHWVDTDRLGEICRRYGLAELALFGSAARGELEPGSDIDLLYVTNPDARLGWRIEELAEELSILCGRPVDLVSKRHLHKLLREQILHDARILYAA